MAYSKDVGQQSRQGSRADFLGCDSHPGRESCATTMGLMLVAGMVASPERTLA